MNNRLNIVNGDACIKIMKEAGIDGDFLPWRDFLHEGPVPTHQSLLEISQIRARFISEYGLGTYEEVQKEFEERDALLLNHLHYAKVTLWFEHDLYDQLQLLQILSWFAKQAQKPPYLTLICTNNHLGESSAYQIKKLIQYETPILKEHLEIAQQAWKSFGNATPIEWEKLLNQSTSILPYLKGAIYRMLEEYPNSKCGLSRSEYQTLIIIANGTDNPLEIFMKYQSCEERRFMGDVIFWKILENFQNHNVIEKIEGKLHITSLGRKLLEGKVYWFTIKPFEKWIGGVKLTPDDIWCWNVEKKQLEHYYYSSVINSLIKIK
ncbi:MAG TPA: DUF1835 domain-containing protein [Campylobacterales bacterium]|nr:DUF1835 domain-containing protein [Campylobacterales bacterium]